MLFTPPELDPLERDVLGQIDDLRDRLKSQLRDPRRWYGSLRRLSFARAIQGSNSIEGYEAGIDDAVDVAAGEEPLDVGEETALALRGYREAMTYVLQLTEEPDFEYNEQLLKALHFMMTGYSLKNRPGRWRAGSIYIRNDESGEIVYEGAEVDQVPKLMGELVDHLNGSPAGSPVIEAAMAHLNLTMIHPFRDGNGRMARCLQSLVLARLGIQGPVFMSIEEYLGRNTQAYYNVLGTVGGGSYQPARDTRPWVRFTLVAHLRQATTMLRRIQESERIWNEIERILESGSLPDRMSQAIFDAILGLRVRNATYRSYFVDTPEEITVATATRDLRVLVEADLLEPRGQRRGRFYVARPKLIKIRESVRAGRRVRDEPDPFG
ncbi:Fic family protein [Actinomycetes bacterium KLBMP 9759]